VKQNDKGLKLESATNQILGFSRIPLEGGDFELDLTQSLAQIGEKVTVFALGDLNDRGLPALNEGDGVGLALEEQSLITKTLQLGVNSGFFINLDRTYYEGKAVVDVTLESDYRGKVVLMAYGGELVTDQTPSLDNIKSLDTKKIYGFSMVEKVSQNVTESIDVLSIGARWPLDVYIIGLHDLNGNMKADPGELLLLPLDEDGKPSKLRLMRSEKKSFQLKFPYSIPLPSPYTMVLKGRFHFGQNVLPKYITILAAENVDIDQIVADPRKYVKAFQKYSVSGRAYALSLLNTPFKPGDKIQLLAIASNDEVGLPKVTENSLVGFYKQDGKLGYQLKDGENTGLDLVVDKITYQDKMSILGILENDYRGPVIASIYGGNPLNLINQNFDLDDFVAVANLTKETGRLEVKLSDLVTQKKLPIRGFPLLIEDRNGNDWPDPGETVNFAYRDDKSEPLFLDINIGSVYSFVFNHKSVVPQPSPQKVIVRGKVNVAGSVGNSKIYVMALDPDLKSFNPSEISQKIYAIEEVSLAQPNFQFNLAKTGRKPGDKIILSALVDRDYQDFPRLSKNDLIGFYSGNNAWSYEIKEGESEILEINVDRPFYDGEAVIEGEITLPVDSSTPRRLLAVAYAGALDSLTEFDVDPNSILGFVQVGSVNRFEMKVTPLGQNFPISLYVFVLNDINGNQKLDPGESLYYSSTRSDRIPERLTINQGQRYQTSLNQEIIVPTPKGHNINIKGRISWLKDDLLSQKPAYLFIARGKSFEDLSTDPLKSMRYLKRIQGFSDNFQINLSRTDLAPGDTVIIGAWIDLDESLGPSVGDRIGTYLKSLEGYTLKLAEKDYDDININVDMTLYGTKKTLDVAFLDSSYSGRVLAVIYKGALKGISLDDINIKDVVGFIDFQKSAQTSSFSIPVLPTQALPIPAVTVLALLDGNSNGVADPGETVTFYSAKAKGFPKSFPLNNEYSGSISLNSPYIIQKPSERSISLKGTIDSNISSTNEYPIAVALFAETSLENLTQEPLRYLKDYKILPPGENQIIMNLSRTDLIEGQKVMMLAIQNPVSDPLMQTQITEGAYLGVLLKSGSFQTSLELAAGVNDFVANSYNLTIKRKFYDHNGRISQIPIGGNLPFKPGDILMIGGYQSEINPTNLVSIVNVDYDKVVSYGRFSFESSAAKYNAPILQALVPGIVKEDTRQINNVLLVGWRDTNKNGNLDDNEPIGFYCEQTNLILPTAVTLRLTQNQFPGIIKFKGEQQTPASLNNQLQFGLQSFFALNICF
jgi:hypothetical protein